MIAWSNKLFWSKLFVACLYLLIVGFKSRVRNLVRPKMRVNAIGIGSSAYQSRV